MTKTTENFIKIFNSIFYISASCQGNISEFNLMFNLTTKVTKTKIKLYNYIDIFKKYILKMTKKKTKLLKL